MVRILSPETSRFEDEVTADYNALLRAGNTNIPQEITGFNQKYNLAYPKDYVVMDEQTQKNYEASQGIFRSTAPIFFRRSGVQDNSLFVVANPEGLFLLFQNPYQVRTGMEHNGLVKFIGDFVQTTVPGTKIDKVREITSPALLEKLADGRLKLLRKTQGKMDVR